MNNLDVNLKEKEDIKEIQIKKKQKQIKKKQKQIKNIENKIENLKLIFKGSNWYFLPTELWEIIVLFIIEIKKRILLAELFVTFAMLEKLMVFI